LKYNEHQTNKNHNTMTSTIVYNTQLSSDELLDRILGIVYGQALGDAFGLATEFMDEPTVAQYFGKDPMKLIPFPNPKKTMHSIRWTTGDWTDDTDQLIVIMKSILDQQNMEVNAVDFAQKLQHWMYNGFPECGDSGGMGIGMTVHAVLTHKQFLKQPKEAAKDVWTKYGKNLAANGAVMRTAILGVLNFDDIQKVIENTTELCHVTHADPRCLASCIAITVAIALILQGHSVATHTDVNQILQTAKQHALNYLTSDLETKQEWIDEFNKYFDATTVDELTLSEGKAIGYTYKCFACGTLALRNLSDPNYTKDYKLLFNEIAFKGGDADTNLAVAGAIAGAYLGYSNLDQQWIKQFPYKSFLDNIVIQFCERLGFDKQTVQNKLN
jgi:ADP-ribosylglycohydrolase